MKNERSIMGLRDLVLLSLLILVVALLVVPLTALAGQLASLVLSAALPALIGGTIYVLMVTRSPKIGTTFTMSLMFGLFYLISGSLVTMLILAGMGVIGELVMLGIGRSKKTYVVPYLIHWLTYTYAATIQSLFMQDQLVEVYIGMGMERAEAAATVATYTALYTAPSTVIISGIATIAATIGGYYIGTRVLSRHFKAAGLA